MEGLFFAVLLTVVLLVWLLDATKRISVTARGMLACYLPAVHNLPLLFVLFYHTFPAGRVWRIFDLIVIGLFCLWVWIRFLVNPNRGEAVPGTKTGRLRAMRGGVFLLRSWVYCVVAQSLFFLIVYPLLWARFSGWLFFTNALYALCVGFVLFLNGFLRIFFTSRRLSILRRLMMILTSWIALVNVFAIWSSCKLVQEEYERDCWRLELRDLRKESELCQTTYPLVMVHGLGFRDLRYFNYWGRIPKELIRNGASIYYGNQEALGTVETNAEDIKQKILQIVKETGCGKVNIIAHSKGGLDARYAISVLGMEQYVASLTTMSTPHGGCKVVDKACRLPDGLYRFVARQFDKTFRKFGDKNPDFYQATRQFSTQDSQRFNAVVQDSPLVYYQSYMSVMKKASSDRLLSIPYRLTKALEGENDGLVGIESAKWGQFQELFTNTKNRGISHGDIIDLKREDYPNFDILEKYVNIVAALKEKGF